MKNFEFQTILILDYRKRNDGKIFHSSAKLITSDSDIDEAFKSMHQVIMKKKKTCPCKNWIDLDIFIKHSILIFKDFYKENRYHEKLEIISNL